VTRRGERFHALTAAIVRRLPFGLSRIVAPSDTMVARCAAHEFAQKYGE